MNKKFKFKGIDKDVIKNDFTPNYYLHPNETISKYAKKGINKEAEIITTHLKIDNKGIFITLGIAFNKNGEIEACNKQKECSKCTAKNVVRNKKCYYCKTKL